MTGFVLLQPLYLLGLAGVAAPIIIHLYGRRRRREVRFPSLQLLKATQQRQRSLVRLRSLIVLLLRILAIICFVLALARPTARPARWASGVIPSPASVAVVLDDSLSMALGTATAFGRARDAADAILAALRGGDDAAVVLTSGSEAHLPARLTRDVASLRRGLQALQPSQRAAGVSSAMASASELLAQSGRPTRRIYVVSDLQAASWESVHVSPATAKLTATVVDVGVTGAENWAIQEVTVTSLVAFANRPVRLRADIRRHGGKVEKRAAVWLGDREPDSGAARTLALPPDGSGSIEFVHRPPKAGDVGITVRLQGDDLPPDNERHVAVHVRDRLEVLCVEGTPGATRFLQRALSPRGEQAGQFGGIRSVPTSPADLSQAAMADRDLVVLAGVPRLSRAQADAAVRYVGAGGGLLIFLGDGVDAAFYNDVLLPGLFGEGHAVVLGRLVGDAADRRSSFAITDFLTARPPLSAFADPSAGSLGRIRFFALREIALTGADSSCVLARFGNGLPAVLEAVCGAGRAIIVNTTADDAWTDAPRRAAYVPLLHRLCHHVARRQAGSPTSLLVGDNVEAPPDSRDSGPATLYDEDGVELQTHAPDAAGIYRAVWGAEKEPTSMLLAVNVDPAESSTERISHREARERLHPLSAQVVTAEELPAARRGGLPRAVDLSLPLLILAIAALAAELLLSGRRTAGARLRQ